MNDNAAKLTQVLTGMLEIDAAALDDAAGPATIKKWNSMTHMKLVAKVEETFGVRFKVRDVVRIKTVGDLRALLAGAGVSLS